MAERIPGVMAETVVRLFARGEAFDSDETLDDAARAGARPNHNLSFARLIGQCDTEMLSNEELSDSLLDILLARRAQIWTRDQFRPERERKR